MRIATWANDMIFHGLASPAPKPVFVAAVRSKSCQTQRKYGTLIGSIHEKG